MQTAIYFCAPSFQDPRKSKHQISQLKEFATQQGWEVKKLDLFDSSDSSFVHTSFQKILRTIKKSPFDVLLFWSLDQLMLEGLFPAIRFLNQLNDQNICFQSFTERGFGTWNLARKSMTSVSAILQHFYLSQSTKEGLTHQKREKTVGPKGYTKPGRPRAKFDIAEAEALRAKNYSHQKIATICGVSKATLWRYFNSH